MKKRPESITFISWFLIVMSVLCLLSLPINLGNLNTPAIQELISKNPIPLPAQILIFLLEIITKIISGIGMLKSRNWGRSLYSISCAIGILIDLLSSPIKTAIIPGIIIFIIIIFFLYKPEANRYFTGSINLD